jgi:hypothetical protein
MKHVALAVCFLSLISAPAGAELKYTVRTEVQKNAAPAKPAKPATPTNPMIAMMGEAMTKQLLPEGTATMHYVVGEKGTRIEFENAAMGQAAGTVALMKPDGTAFMMNPKDQTYWKMTLQAAATAMKSAGITPQVTSNKTGEAETVAGVHCERTTFTMKLDLPIPDAARASLGKDFPASIDMDGDTCATTDQFQKYADLAVKTQAAGMLSALGLEKLAQSGIVLRQDIRMGGVDMRSVVTEIAEEDVPATTFEVPATFKEVPPPTPTAPVR